MNDRPRRDAKAVFLAAIENHTPDQWGAYLDEACGGDESLRGLVEALLRAHQEKDSVFDDAAEALRESLSGLSRIVLPEATGDDSPLATSAGRGTGEKPPDRVGRYRIVGEIARGGVGAVYKAHDDDIGRSLAIKLLLNDHRRNPEMLQRFMEEVQISGQLQHPGIVPIHDVGLFAAEKPYFAMKLIKGQTLAKVLDARQDPGQDRQRFLGIFEHICETIAYAHARGVIHRDLKPSNVMIGSFGEVQVVDWGLAKVLAQGGIADDGMAGSEAAHTAIATVRSGSTASDSLVGSVLGTPAYMSPEQARGDIDELDERSDVFGLGAILCEILTGKPPYVASTARELLNQAKKGYLEDAEARIDACGADLRVIDLARRCLAFEPRERPRDAKAVSLEISAYLQSLEEKARESEIRAAQNRTRAEEERKARRRTIVLAAVVVVVGFFGGSGYLWVDGQRRDAVARAENEKRQAAERASAQVEHALARALLLRAEAVSASETEIELTSWNAVREAVDQARSFAADQVAFTQRSALDAIHSEVEGALRLREFLASIREAQSADSEEEMDRKYWDAFLSFLRTDVSELSPVEIAARLRSKRFDPEIALALDEWALVRMGRKRPWRRLKDAALALDRNPFRVAMWKAIEDHEPTELDELASASIDSTPAALLSLVAEWLVGAGEVEKAERLARRAVRLEPESFRANLALGRLLTRPDVARFSASVPYLTAARALRPQSHGVLKVFFEALIGTGATEEALRVFEEMAARDIYWAWKNRSVFGRRDLEFSAAALEEFVRRFRRRNRGAPETLAAEVLDQVLLRLCEEGRGDVAERIALDAFATGRDVPSALYSLARVRFALGRPVQAIRILEEALASPQQPWTWWSPDYPEADLAKFRRSVAPELVSPASVDDALKVIVVADPDLDFQGLPRRAESIRRRLWKKGAPALGAYLDGRLLELGGDLKGAGERYRAAIELDRTLVAPFARLHEVLRRSRGADVADAVVRAELAEGAPEGLLQLPPQPPRDLQSRTQGEGVHLRASDFAHVDRRVRHVASRWRVRRQEGDYDRSPVVDTVSREHLTELTLPPEALQPRTKYFWTVSYLGNAGAFATSEEGAFVTEDYVFEIEQFSLDRHFNRDVVTNPDDGPSETIEERSSLVVEGFDGKRGLPPNRRVGVHRLGDYSDRNCVQLRASDTKAIRVDVPQRRYREVRFLATGGFGDSRIPVTFLYTDGDSETQMLSCEDWLDDPMFHQSIWGAIASGVQPVANGMDALPGQPHHRGDVALFEASLETDPDRTLAAFVLQPAGMSVASEKTRFNLLAATGVWTYGQADGRR